MTKDVRIRVRPAARRRARTTMMHAIRLVPTYLRLLGGMVGDRRVSTVDKLFLGAAIAYVVSPVDLIPDFIPFLGLTDDVFLIGAAVERMIRNAGRGVVMSHWHGDPRDLSRSALTAVISAAALFMPQRVRRHLRRKVRRG